MKNIAANLTAYAQYFVKFVAAYKAQGINIEMVAPQNEPNYSQGYPSALWDSTLYTTFVKTYLGPALNGMNVKIMLGTMSNGDDGARARTSMVVQNAMGDATAKPLFKAIGLQWGMLDLYKGTPSMFDTYNIPVWATEHKCGNYPWLTRVQGAGAQRSGLRRRVLGLHPRRDQGGRHRLQRLEHGARHRRQGQRHGPAVGAGRAADR